MTSPDTLQHITLHLARCAEFPEGSDRHGYSFRAPLDARGQFADKGSQYLGGIFTHDEAQAALAEESKAQLTARFGRPIASFVRPAETFYPAEDYHQQYYLKNPARYQQYSAHNGRKERLADVWTD